MQKDFDALMANGTWELVPCLKIIDHIGSKWVYRRNLKLDGLMDKYKESLVEKGYDKFE